MTSVSLCSIAADTDGRWFFSGEIVPNPSSVALPSWRAWEIESPAPWPPVIGFLLWLCVPGDLPCDSPDRAPGAVKLTSRVSRVIASTRPSGTAETTLPWH